MKVVKLVLVQIDQLKDRRLMLVIRKRTEIALYFRYGEYDKALSKVDDLMEEQKLLEANEYLKLYCVALKRRLPTITALRKCPASFEEVISTLIFAAANCSEISQLVALTDIFEKKYGKDFIEATTDLKPNCGIAQKRSGKTPAGEEVKLKVLQQISKRYKIKWDPTKLK